MTTTISARVVADSITETGSRLTTLQLKYPRFIHAEFMTHRVFSRNASSSRAIPVTKMISEVETNPVVPLVWGKNQPGMQARERVNDMVEHYCRREWHKAAASAANHARVMVELGLHKQVINRLLEPWLHIKVVVTATEWENFFNLRIHPDAEPHIHMLAAEMRDAMAGSTPRELKMGQWHVPYAEDLIPTTTEEPWDRLAWRPAIQASVARCARVSYLTHAGLNPDTKSDLALYEKLVGSRPIHASPAEHQGMPDPFGKYHHQWANFKGWVQYRQVLEMEA